MTYEKNTNETMDQFLQRIGRMKEDGVCSMTWPELTIVFNSAVESDGVEHTESWWRKRYHSLRLQQSVDEQSSEEEWETDPSGGDFVNYIRELEKQRIRTRDERLSMRRMLSSDARQETILDLFKQEIRRATPARRQPIRNAGNSVLIAMLSDVHYGMNYDNRVGVYNSDIARKRVMNYASEIIRLGEKNRAKTCVVALMGDLVSGCIHSTIRIENKENVIEQVIGVSELVSSFLYELASRFENVIVGSVDGNHSRIENNLEDALRGEKLDALVPWYCKTKLENISNVEFMDNEYDPSIGTFLVHGKQFVYVHGDMDGDLRTSAQRIEHLIGRKVDCILAGHMHIAEMRNDAVLIVRNGSVCGSGDEYTVKKRLFGPPAQVVLCVTDTGVESIYPVSL